MRITFMGVPERIGDGLALIEPWGPAVRFGLGRLPEISHPVSEEPLTRTKVGLEFAGSDGFGIEEKRSGRIWRILVESIAQAGPGAVWSLSSESLPLDRATDNVPIGWL